MYHTDKVYAWNPTKKAAMTDHCIHGFDAQHCASCRRCSHGLLESRCSQCGPPRTAREATTMLANDAPQPSTSHRGHEILYVAGERSWYFRADADSPRSAVSFRSSFLARRAVDALLDAPAKGAGQKRG
jgi:ribosomal protein L37E